uniref:CSON013646 protein n=1 Tax=Culicoides sonorensis TaxID=179676 RepID=A0A336LM10_CULSO
MYSTDTTYSSSDSSNFVKRRSRIFSLFKFNGHKMQENLHRKFSEPNPAELLLFRKRGAPQIKLWTPDNTEVFRCRDDLILENIKRKNSVTKKLKRKKSRRGTITSEDEEQKLQQFSNDDNTSTPLKRSRSFRENWNRLWHKNAKYSVTHSSSSASNSSASDKSECHPKCKKRISYTEAINDKSNSNEVKIKDNNDNLLSVIFANTDIHHNKIKQGDNQKENNIKCSKLCRSENDLTGNTINSDFVSLDKCQNYTKKNYSLTIKKGHTRRRSWTDYFNFGTNQIKRGLLQKSRSTSSVGGSTHLARSAPATPISSILVTDIIPSNVIERSPSQSPLKTELRSSKIQSSSQVAATTVRSSSPHPSKPVKNDSQDKPDKPEKSEKEKKKKEVSSSRQKRFHRHFQQVAENEKVINYFSCALVADILLQGHLYITENYFAFYSNVFGYVTKLLIPIITVVKISREKTAKIFPNAVCVCTAEERHVFGSFISREAAFRLMISVWHPLPSEPEEVEAPTKVPDVEISECSVEDESSCSASGNEGGIKTSREGLLIATALPVALPTKFSTDLILPTNRMHKSASMIDIKGALSNHKNNIIVNEASTAKSTPSPSTSTPSTTRSSFQFKSHRYFTQLIPSEFQIVHLGVFLAVVLAIFSAFLMYRIQDIEYRTTSLHPPDLKWGDDKDMDIYAEVLKWQRQLQAKSVSEAEIVLNSNLEQIARVRKSLETLSLLIHDRSTRLAALSGVDPALHISLDDSSTTGNTFSINNNNIYEHDQET